MAELGHSLEYLAARAGMGIARTLSASMADRFGAGLGRLAHALLGSRRDLARDNIKKALGDRFSESEIDAIVRRVFENIGRTLIEVARFPKLGPDRVREMIIPAGLEVVRSALKEGRGAIIGSAHFGNWEIMGAFLALHGIPSNSLVMQQHNPKINRMLINLRRSLGVNVLEVPAKSRQVFRALDENRVVVLAADQHAAAGTLVMEFFGRPAAVARGPALFAVRRNCPLIPMLLVRERYDRHRVIAGETIYPPSSGDEEQDLMGMTSAYLRFLEEQITAYPDQWLWTHNRWKLKNADNNSEPSTL